MALVQVPSCSAVYSGWHTRSCERDGDSVALGHLRLTKLSSLLASLCGTMKLSHHVILSEDNRRVTSSQFQGGTLTAVLATADLDLREAEVSMPPAVLNVQALLAELDITVPDDWQIETELTTPVTEFRDLRRTRPAADEAQDGPGLHPHWICNARRGDPQGLIGVNCVDSTGVIESFTSLGWAVVERVKRYVLTQQGSGCLLGKLLRPHKALSVQSRMK